jgi:hypothetical protein
MNVVIIADLFVEPEPLIVAHAPDLQQGANRVLRLRTILAEIGAPRGGFEDRLYHYPRPPWLTHHNLERLVYGSTPFRPSFTLKELPE